MGEKFQDAFGGMNGQPKTKRDEGSITFENSPNNNPTSKSKVGEYVDYEEID